MSFVDDYRVPLIGVVLFLLVLTVPGFLEGDSLSGVQSASPEGVEYTGLNVFLSGTSGCDSGSYDKCLETSNSFDDAVANPELRIDEVDYLAVRDNMFIVEPGYSLDYSCNGVKAWFSEGTGSPDLSWSSEGVFGGDSLQKIDLTGSIDLSEKGVGTGFQVTCADHSVTDVAWSGTSVYNYWTLGVRDAVDSDSDGIYDFRDDCSGLKGPESNSGCPVNSDPVVNELSVPDRVAPREKFTASVDARDPDGDSLSYEWFNGGSGNSTEVVFEDEGVYSVGVNVSDGLGGSVSVSRDVVVSSSELGLWGKVVFWFSNIF